MCAQICPLFELNGHSYTGYVKSTRTNPGSVKKHGGKRNSCPDDMNFAKEDAEHADLTKCDTYRSGPDRVAECHVLDHPDQSHDRVAASTKKGSVHADDQMQEQTCENCGMALALGMLLLRCDCLAEENSDSPECTKKGEPVDGEKASCVKTDTVYFNTSPCDLTTHCTTYVEYYCMGDKRRTHLTHDHVYGQSDLTEQTIYLTRMSEPDAYCLSHDRPT